ncbi:MAG TPA: RDD family protein, partial [Planctomycetaceae bacterium]|nr:RDD family protein [Planctomycetaceae bacterium]
MSQKARHIGWWIESEDEEVYGPVSRATVQRFLREGVISRNTLVRHCTDQESRPVADVPGMLEGIELPEAAPVTGDRLREVWPSRRAEREQLAASDIPCLRHRRPAVLVCARCHAPYCTKCRMKPFRRQFYLCRRCQANVNNRRLFAFFLDGFLINFLPMMLLAPLVVIAAGPSRWATGPAEVVMNLVALALTVVFVLRDAIFRGAGPAKRLFGLRVVRAEDLTTPLSYWQAVIRYLSLLIPFAPII